jgi:phage-related protein
MLLHELGRDTWAVLAIARSGTECELKLVTGIYEFRMTPKRGPALRVLWMYNEGRTIVCIHGYWKTTQRTLLAEIEKARRLRSDYLLAKRRNLLEIASVDWTRAP